MIPEGNLRSNIDRFLGFEQLYDRFRPEAPPQVVDLLTRYLSGKPALVVDLGCGTGLSTFAWKDDAERIIGVEPNPDMIGKAKAKQAAMDNTGHMSFIQGYSNEIAIPDGSAQIVTCSQSFHWMEPVSTLREVSRILADGGIFAAYDCDWPPTVHWSIEDAYNRLLAKSDALLSRLASPDEQAIKRDKEQHLQQLRHSGLFRYTKEIVFHNVEQGDAERFVGLAVSQGGLQTVLKLGSAELDEDIAAFRRSAENYFAGRTLEFIFSYRMRLGIK
ncbi:class I SAM-dependent methyltransferase [Paenibacillus hodogayensis]|uniref:Class I SAM-dependent methyltransferase n=1 Tax=Paenibacillus hodogayensis TaxID=279208 RepID=A0ABV5W0X7_9BACL